MRCEIVRDLLPLYIEGLCSPESRNSVEEHLNGCADCLKYFEELSSDIIPGSAAGPDNPPPYLQDRDLLAKSKSAIKKEFAAKILRGVMASVLALSLCCCLFIFLLSVFGYGLRYPSLYFGELKSVQVLVLLLPFVPAAISLIGVLLLKKDCSGNRRFKSGVVSLCLLAPSLLVGLACSLLYLVLPPLCSSTNRVSDYMELDRDLEGYADRLMEILPRQLPENAEDVEYHYLRYAALFSERTSIDLSMTLHPEDYEREKARVLNLPCFRDGEDTCALLPGVSVRFSFDDQDRTLVYSADILGVE